MDPDMSLNMLEEIAQFCPYCGEPITLLIDTSITQQNYIEDCSVCCRPITVKVLLNDSADIQLELFQENDHF